MKLVPRLVCRVRIGKSVVAMFRVVVTSIKANSKLGSELTCLMRICRTLGHTDKQRNASAYF